MTPPFSAAIITPGASIKAAVARNASLRLIVKLPALGSDLMGSIIMLYQSL
jgi:hypothetical protein